VIYITTPAWFVTFSSTPYYSFKIFDLSSADTSRLTVVSCEAKKGQNDHQKQNARQTTVCLLHERTFLSFDVIITVNTS